MRSTLPLVLVTAITLGTSAVSHAQAPQPVRDGSMIYFLPTESKALREELKVTEEQAGKLRESVGPIQAMRRELMRDFDPRTVTDDRMKELTEESAKLNEKAKTAVLGILKPEQFKRLRQIEFQAAGSRAFLDNEVQAALKLTDEQKKKAGEIQDELMKSAKEMQKKAIAAVVEAQSKEDRVKLLQGMNEQQRALRQKADENSAKLLTDDQTKAWKELQGAKFDLASLMPERKKKDQ